MNIKSIVTGLALCILGIWCIYYGANNWSDREKNEFPAVRYIGWGAFTLFMGLVAVFLGYIGWWESYV